MQYLTRLEFEGPDPQQEFLKHAAKLEDLLSRLPGGSVMGAHKESAFAYIRALLAILIDVNGNVSYPEIDLLRRYHLDSYSVHEEIESVRDTVRDHPGFLGQVPTFLTQAVALRAGHPTLAPEILGAIQGMCGAITRADRLVDPSESTAVQAYLRLLAGEVQAPLSTG